MLIRAFLRCVAPNDDLPEIRFPHLARASDAIDRGVEVGRPFQGQAPDLGAFEFR